MPEFNLSYMSKWQNRVAWSLASASEPQGEQVPSGCEAANEVEVAQLHRQVMRLQQTIIELATTVNTMALLLVDRGGLDPKLLETKVAAALATQRLALANTGPTVVCTKCGITVVANLSVITPTGVVCDKCAAGVAP